MPLARRALIVGNSDGIGLALTRRLLAEGWTVVGISRRPSPVRAAGYRHAVADVAAVDYRAALQGLQASEAPFDACVYLRGDRRAVRPSQTRAGGRGRSGQSRRCHRDGLRRAAADDRRRARPSGRPLQHRRDGVSDTALSYAASKAGLSSYLGGLALALRPRGVQVTNVRFGFVDTKMAKYPVRPFMITAERAAEVVARCLHRPLRRRPARVTYPWRMGALVWVLDRLTALRLWLARG